MSATRCLKHILLLSLFALMALCAAYPALAVAPTVTAVTAPNPASDPAATSITLTLSGTGFDAVTPANNVIKFNGTALASQTVTAATTTSLTATVTLPAIAKNYTVSVTTGGVDSTINTAFTVSPTVTAITAPNPASDPAATSITLTLSGTGFDAVTPANNVIKFNGTALASQTVTAATTTTLTATVTLPAIAKSYTVSVTTNTVNSTSLAPVTFSATPTVTAVNPTSGPAGATNVILVLTGTGFDTGTLANNVIKFNGTALTQTVTAATATTLTATVTLPATATASTVSVTINAADATSPPTVTFTTASATLTGYDLTSGNPTGATTGNAGTTATLVLDGTNFSPTAADNKVTLTPNGGGTALTVTATAVDTTDPLKNILTVAGLTLPALADTYTITVQVGAAASVGSPMPTTFAVTPTVTSPASPTTGPAGASSFALTLTGTGFDTALPASNTVTFTPTGGGTAVSFGAATQATSTTSLTVTGTLPPTATMYNVTVTTRRQTTLTPVTFTTTAATLASISPAKGAAGTAAFSLVVTGSGFNTSAADNQVIFTDSKGVDTNFGAPVTATAGGTTLNVTGTVPNPADTYTVTVKVGTSNAIGSSPNPTKFVANPTVSGTPAPASGPAGATSFTLTLTGSGFDTGTPANNVIMFNGIALAPQTITAATTTSLTATVTLPATAVTNTVSVVTRGVASTSPASIIFTTIGTTLTGYDLTSGNPTGATTGNAGTTATLVLDGTNFSPTAADNKVTLTPNGGGTALTVTATAVDTTDPLKNILTVAGLTLPALADTYTITVQVGAAASVGSTPSTTFAVTPTLTALDKVSGPAGASGFVLTLTGSGFDTGTLANNVIKFNGTALTQTVTAATATTLTATVTLPVTPTVSTVTVTTRGQTTTAPPTVTFTTASATLTGYDLTSGNPTGATTGNAGTTATLVLDGTNFSPTAADNKVTLTPNGGGTALTVTATAVDTTPPAKNILTVAGLTLPALADTYTITVQVGAAASVGSTPSTTFAVTPTIAALNPTTGSHSVSITLNLSGSGFDTASPGRNIVTFTSTAAGSTALSFGVAAIAASNSSLSVPGTLPTTSGTYNVTVTTRGQASTSQTFTVNAAPKIDPITTDATTGLSPIIGIQGSTLALKFKGTGFTTDTTNTVNFSDGTTFGSAVATSATSLTVTGTLPTATGADTVTVTNANGTSNAANFTVGSSGLTLNSVTSNPSAALEATAVELTLNGSGFDSGTVANNKVYFTQNFAQAKNGAPQLFGSAKTVTGGTQLIVEGTLPATAGNYTITVQIPDPVHTGSSLTSTPQSFTVNNPLPSIGSIGATVKGIASPVSSVNTGTQLQNLIITGTVIPDPTNSANTIPTPGTGFISDYTDANGKTVVGSTVTFTQGGATLPAAGLSYEVSSSATTKPNDTLTITGIPKGTAIPAGLTDAAGPITVIVHNPGPGGGPSNAGTFVVTYPNPTITAVTDDKSPSQTSDPAGSAISLIITGTNFFSGASTVSVAAVDGTLIATATASSSNTKTPSDKITQQITIPVTLPATPQTIKITVTNPAVNGNGSASASKTFTVTAAPITLTPNAAYVGDPTAASLTVTTNGVFPIGSEVLLQPSNNAILLPTFTVEKTDPNAPSLLLFGPSTIPGSTIIAPLLPLAGFVEPAINGIGEYQVIVKQSAADQPSATFSAYPLGPSLTQKNGAISRYFAWTPPISTPGTPTSTDGLLLFSVPYDYSDQVIEAKTPDPTSPGKSFLAEINTTTLLTSLVPYSNLAVWNPLTPGYDVTGTAGTLANTLALGQGYWGRFPIIGTNPTIVGLVKRGTPATTYLSDSTKLNIKVDAQGRFIIPLHPGWNMIGDPWAEVEGQPGQDIVPNGVLLQNMQVLETANSNVPLSLTDADTAGLASAVFYDYNSSTNKYEPVNGFTSGTKILPYVGYWVHAYRDCTLLVPQP